MPSTPSGKDIKQIGTSQWVPQWARQDYSLDFGVVIGPPE
jgi:hypothetical protein